MHLRFLGSLVSSILTENLRFRKGISVDTYKPSTVDKDLRPSGTLGHQLRPVLQLGVLLLQNLQGYMYNM